LSSFDLQTLQAWLDEIQASIYVSILNLTQNGDDALEVLLLADPTNQPTRVPAPQTQWPHSTPAV
jgi:hypothetical protein